MFKTPHTIPVIAYADPASLRLFFTLVALLVLIPLELIAAPAKKGLIPTLHYPGPAVELYRTKHYQSPVRGEPGGLVVIPGSGLGPHTQVAYAAFSGPNPPASPGLISSTPTVTKGYLELDDGADQDAVTGRFPDIIDSRSSYALFARNSSLQPASRLRSTIRDRCGSRRIWPMKPDRSGACRAAYGSSAVTFFRVEHGRGESSRAMCG